jgi:hypothetical protein
VLLYRHHTSGDVIDFDPATGHWRYVEEDRHPAVSALSTAYRRNAPIPGTYTVEDQRMYCMYWTPEGVLVLHMPDQRRHALFRHGGGEDDQLEDMRQGLRIELAGTPGRNGYNTLRISGADGHVIHQLTYHALPYTLLYGADFTYNDRILADWDFFEGLKDAIEDLEAKLQGPSIG